MHAETLTPNPKPRMHTIDGTGFLLVMFLEPDGYDCCTWSMQVASGSILDQTIVSDKKGKSYYYYHILTRTADGEGGGRHHLLVSTVSGGKLYTLQVQTLDKQWFKGQDKSVQTVAKSFTVS